ncbi:MAG: hypothetical protein QFF03_09770 [Pseudomonadota bacterium]|nr:hypothetical protein [Pseudomonadota bacterium]
MNLKKIIRVSVLLVSLFGALTAQAAPRSCYRGELQNLKPGGSTDVAIVVDETTERARATAERDFRAAVSSLTDRAVNISLLAYAGHAPGQSLRLIGQWQIEPQLVDNVLQDVVISEAQQLQACLRVQKSATKKGLDQALDTLFTSMPIDAARSEITYALRTVLHDFVMPERATLILHYSDALQHSKGVGGRSFYAADKQPRQINPALELTAMARETAAARADKPPHSYVSLLWWGTLLMPQNQVRPQKVAYLDSATIEAYRSFWTGYLQAVGVDKVQIGTPSVFNPDLRLPALP